MIGAVDDILFHVKRIGPVLRMLLVGAVAFVAAELMYGSRGPDSGVFQFILYGLVGFIPGVGLVVAGAQIRRGGAGRAAASWPDRQAADATDRPASVTLAASIG